jgi:hydroxymethylpyrimidine/phosphomethylpyrimidine kinase
VYLGGKLKSNFGVLAVVGILSASALTGCSSELASAAEIREVCVSLSGQNSRDVENSLEIIETLKPLIAVITANNPTEAKDILETVSSIESDARTSNAEVSLFFMGSILDKSDKEIDDFTDKQELGLAKMKESYDALASYCIPFLQNN